jgi:hypothetical protein
VDPVPDPLLLRKSGSVWNRSQEARNCDHQTTEAVIIIIIMMTNRFVGLEIWMRRKDPLWMHLELRNCA